MFIHSTFARFTCVIALLTTAAMGQTYYSPGGVGTVGADVPPKKTDTTADRFAWDLNANSTATGFDTYLGEAQTTLTINGSGGEVFRVVFGAGVNINNTFWNTNQTWTGFISASGNGVIPNLSQTSVSAYTYSGGTYTLVNTSTRGSFSLSNNNLTWTAVPEPTSALAGLLILSGLLRRRR